MFPSNLPNGDDRSQNASATSAGWAFSVNLIASRHCWRVTRSGLLTLFGLGILAAPSVRRERARFHQAFQGRSLLRAEENAFRENMMSSNERIVMVQAFLALFAAASAAVAAAGVRHTDQRQPHVIDLKNNFDAVMMWPWPAARSPVSRQIYRQVTSNDRRERPVRHAGSHRYPRPHVESTGRRSSGPQP